MSTAIRDTLRAAIEGMGDSDPETVKTWTRFWAWAWNCALDNVRRMNNRELLQDMLDTGHPVPAEFARQLLDLKGPRNRPPVIRETPEEVVTLVRRAIIRGHPFPTPDGSSGDHSAFDEVSGQLGCSPSTVERYYKACPRAVRDKTKENEEALHRILAALHCAKTPEEKKRVHEEMDAFCRSVENG